MSVKSTILFLFLAPWVHSVIAACSGRPTYNLLFDFDWSFETDRAFPNKNPVKAPSFSKLVCVSHSRNFTLWQPGAILNEYMVDLVSNGRLNSLQTNIQSGMDNQTIHDRDISEEGSFSLGELAATLKVIPSHPLISCASRIEPSPSWFIGVSALNMCKNNTFRKTHDLTIVGWWGGLDEGDDYTETAPIPPERRFKVRRRIDVAPFGYGTIFISRDGSPKPPGNQAGPNAGGSSFSRIVPAAEAICIDANALQHLPPEALLFPTHRHAYVLCDLFNSCATPGHIVVYKGNPMMMKSYCQYESICERRLMLVNSPKYSRAIRIDSTTQDLRFTAFAARFSTRTEEGVFSLAVRMGL